MSHDHGDVGILGMRLMTLILTDISWTEAHCDVVDYMYDLRLHALLNAPRNRNLFLHILLCTYVHGNLDISGSGAAIAQHIQYYVHMYFCV